MAMDDGDGSLHSIMEVLDSVYGGATTYSALMSKLNTVQQGNRESAKDYYERVVQIRVKLQEFHHYMFRLGDLEYHAKNAFFNGLCPEYQAMVIHKQDDPQTTITHLLITVQSVKRLKLSTIAADGRRMLRHTPCLGASPHTELTTQIHNSIGRIIVIKISHATAGRTTMVPTSPSMSHKWSRPWKLKSKRTTSRRTLIMTMTHKTEMMWS